MLWAGKKGPNNCIAGKKKGAPNIFSALRAKIIELPILIVGKTMVLRPHRQGEYWFMPVDKSDLLYGTWCV